MTITSALNERQRLELAERAVVGALSDIGRAGDAAQRYACYAAVWAAVLMVADILRTALAAKDPRAAALFLAISKSVEWANKLLSYWGHTPIATKSDVLKRVDPRFKGAVHFLDDIRSFRTIINKLKVSTKYSAELGLVMDLGMAMADDTILILDAGETANNAAGSVIAAARSTRESLRRIRERIREINRLINYEYEYEQAERASRTA